MLLLNQLRDVCGHFNVVIGMAYDNQDVDFVAGIGGRIWFGLLSCRELKSNTEKEEAEPMQASNFHSSILIKFEKWTSTTAGARQCRDFTLKTRT